MAENVVNKESANCNLKRQFDLTQWYYWSVWWQQLLYSHYHLNTQSSQANQTPNYSYMAPPPHGGVTVPDIMNPRPPGLTTVTQVRTVSGYETYISSTLRRLVAELIDILLISFLLKWYFPNLDYRVPEAIFLGADVVLKMDDDELEEMGWTVLVFISSVLLERIVHLIMETVFIHRYGFTPGKYMMGLRLYRCTRVQFTRTYPGYTIKIKPGIKLGFWQSFLRALFKFIANMFCPLIIFFITLDRGRTQYDRAFKSIIVNARELYRPVYTTTTNINNH